MSNNENNKIVDLRSLSCPFAAGVAMTPQGQVASVIPPCTKEKCAVWDSVSNMCSVLSLAGDADSIREVLASVSCQLSNLRMVLEPPKDSPSPLMRIAESLMQLVKNQETRKG